MMDHCQCVIISRYISSANSQAGTAGHVFQPGATGRLLITGTSFPSQSLPYLHFLPRSQWLEPSGKAVPSLGLTGRTGHRRQVPGFNEEQ